MSRNYDEMIDECTGNAFTNGAHIDAYKRAEKNRKQRKQVRQLGKINLQLPEEIKRTNGWFPVMWKGSFNIVKDPNSVISFNGKIPQITSEAVEGLTFLTRNTVIQSGIDKYGGMTKVEVPYSEIIDSMTKDRIIKICCEANRLGL